jgi:hypothetical protein
MADLAGSPIWRHFMEHWQSSVTVKIDFVFFFTGHCRLLMLLLSSLSSMGLKNLMHVSLLQTPESFHWNVMIKHKDVSDFVLLLGESLESLRLQVKASSHNHSELWTSSHPWTPFFPSIH